MKDKRTRQRKQIWDKSGGLCWYCGCELPEKGWHADHMEPILRGCGIGGKDFRPENDTLENLVPTCARCNNLKWAGNVEQFRKQVANQVKLARQKSVNFRTAERFGQIVVCESPIVFWFESPKGKAWLEEQER